MFFGRHDELKKLEGLYNSEKFECVILHGRLRVGKTTLLREFMGGKKSIYFSAQETSSRENLKNLARCVASTTPDGANPSEVKEYYEEIFERVNTLARSERILLIIDDYHFLAAADKGISSLICRFIDHKLVDSQLMLVVCGSSEPVMQSETLGYDSPFHGRRTAQINLQPFNFFEARRFYTGFSSDDIAVLYGVTGGVPGYLEVMDPELPVEENIKQAFFNKSSFLFEEPANYLRREVRDPAYYSAVLRSIATGLSKNSEIATAVGLETSACTAYLKNLIAMGLVHKHTPVTEKAGKKTIYEIEDSTFRFWYRFIPNNMSMIMSGMVDKIWRSVASDIPQFMNTVFEDICRQWVRQRNHTGRLPVKFVEVGRWWGVDPVLKKDTAIPILAYCDDEHALFGDCVWANTPADADALASLEERSRLFRYPNRYLYLFSRSGFSDECADEARRIGANLIVFE